MIPRVERRRGSEGRRWASSAGAVSATLTRTPTTAGFTRSMTSAKPIGAGAPKASTSAACAGDRREANMRDVTPQHLKSYQDALPCDLKLAYRAFLEPVPPQRYEGALDLIRPSPKLRLECKDRVILAVRMVDFCIDFEHDPSRISPATIKKLNNAAADLPDQTQLKGRKLPSMSVVLDGKGDNFANVFEPRNRRVWVPLSTIPDVVQRAFVAAEDRRFFEHHGVDERGIIRAFIGNLADPGRPQGGSTITQQVVKNLLVGGDVTYERKIREMIVASRVESTLSKQAILELYLNSAYLGRGSWGVEMAARSYFGKSAQDLTVAEGAMLAGLLKGPSFFNPDRHPDRAKERLAYVLGRMQEDGVLSAEDKDHALAAPPKLVAFEQKRRDKGLHFIDFLSREARTDGIPSLTAEPFTVRSTINRALQREAEAALQEGLARYEIDAGRVKFRGPEANVSDTIQKLMLGRQSDAPDVLPAWQQALQAVKLPLSDVHWEPAVILDKGGGKRGDGNIRVGIRDGRILPLNAANANWDAKRNLGLYDVVYVRVIEGKTAAKPKNGGAPAAVGTVGARAELRCAPPCKGRRWCWRTRPDAFWRWPGASPISPAS